MSKMLTTASRVPTPFNESYRLSVLKSCDALDRPVDPDLQRIVQLASRRFAVPIALISLIDSDRQWFFAQVGLTAEEGPRDQAFCAHAIVASSPLIVCDALQDPRFCDNPLVVDAPHIRFYAGVPLVIEGAAIGTLCMVDFEPRAALNSEELADLEDLAGLATGLIKARRDVDIAARLDRTEQEDERIQALALLSHELRTPLNAIVGFADLIAREINGPIEPPVYREYAEAMCDGGRRLERFADRVLRYTEIAYGQVRVCEERVEAKSIAERACGLVAAKAQAKGVPLQIEPSEETAEALLVQVDPDLLEQALVQVLYNAVEHGAAEQRQPGDQTAAPPVVLFWGIQDGVPSFAVRDRGIGLSPDSWESLTSPFHSGGSTGRQGQGDSGDCGNLGLGLALAKRLIELHGGQLTLDDCSSGEGCTVRLSLPHWRIIGNDDLSA